MAFSRKFQKQAKFFYFNEKGVFSYRNHFEMSQCTDLSQI